MKFRVTTKIDPYEFGEAIQEAAEESIQYIETRDIQDREDLLEARFDSLSEECDHWFYGGVDGNWHLTVEIDTAARTATVVPDEGTDDWTDE